MRIAITASGPGLDAEVESNFGRCRFFLIVETDELSVEAIANENTALGQGAGIQGARQLAQRGVAHLLTGNCGPHAMRALAASEIAVTVGCAGTVRNVVEQFAAGRLQS